MKFKLYLIDALFVYDDVRQANPLPVLLSASIPKRVTCFVEGGTAGNNILNTTIKIKESIYQPIPVIIIF